MLFWHILDLNWKHMFGLQESLEKDLITLIMIEFRNIQQFLIWIHILTINCLFCTKLIAL